MKVSELFAEIGFKVDEKGLNLFSEKMKEVQATIKSCLSGLREFAKAAEQINKAVQNIKTTYLPTQKEMASRYRAQTYYIRSLGKELRGRSELESGKGNYWGKRAELADIDSYRLWRSLFVREENLRLRKEGTLKKEQNKDGWLKKIFGSGATSLIAGILSFKAAVSTFEKAAKIFEQSISRAFTYSNISYTTGIDMEKLSMLQNLVERGGTGLSQEDVARDIKSVQQNLMAIRYGQGNIAPYKMLGISAYGNDPFSVIAQLKESVKHLDNVTASYFLGQMGFSHPDWLRVLREDIQPRFLDEFTKPTSGERKDTSILGISWRRFETSIRDIFDRLVAFLSGPVSFILDSLSTIVDFLNTVLSPLLKGISYTFGFIEGVLTGFAAFVSLKMTELILAVKDLAFWKRGGKPSYEMSAKELFESLKKDIGERMHIEQNPTVVVKSPEEAVRYQNEMMRQGINMFNNPLTYDNSYNQGSFVSA